MTHVMSGVTCNESHVLCHVTSTSATAKDPQPANSPTMHYALCTMQPSLYSDGVRRTYKKED